MSKYRACVHFCAAALLLMGLAFGQGPGAPPPSATLDSGLPNIYFPTAPPLLTGATSRVSASQPILKVPYYFTTNGAPSAIVEVAPGKFLGIVNLGAGIFSITAQGSYRTVYLFPMETTGLDAIGLSAALNGQTYGSAESLGPVTTFSELFSVAANGTVTTYPYDGVTQGGPNIQVQSPDNHLYAIFGIVGGSQTFSRMDYLGNPTPLYTFTTPGFPGFGTFFLGADGSFYGLWLSTNTEAGIYRLTPSGSFSWVTPSFVTGGVNNNQIGLIQASNGNFYGTLPQNGGAGAGTIYEATTGGKIRTIYSFPQKQLGFPNGLLQASDGKLYGTATGEYYAGYHGHSSIFRLDPTTNQFETLVGFNADGSQGGCPCYMVQGSDGKLYGVAANLGLGGAGTFFVLDAGLPPPKPGITQFRPQSGAAGQEVLLWGASLLGTTAVSFNGTAATSFRVASSQGVWAKVPSGATTGPITITTPNGSFTTQQSFTVRQGKVWR